MSGASGDEWVEGPDGARYWGRYGAAGLLVVSPDAEVLLQHRALWSHFGGTWGVPGGARHEHETAVEAAVREAGEEAGVPATLLDVRFSTVLDLGYWSYTTVVVDARERFEPVVSDPESIELRWIAVGRVDSLSLHPRFAEAWPSLAARL
ncbi:NUDIX domain-containing protein [Agromyces subbeticus]|uniref:NUDIX domain-containing protein n=1 Tax=Agromyces subbeticus TaxID=293890 RepID=UPI0003B4819E|nr:NUDIX hydrolase [Agromyces subbeticus]